MDLYSGDISTTGRIEVGTSLTGEIDFVGDKDWFRVDLAAGSRYRFTLTTETLSDLGTLDYFAFEGLIDPDGRNLTYGQQADTPFETAATFEHLALQSGTYFLPLRGAPAFLSTPAQQVGGYRLSVEQVIDADDHGSSPSTATPLALGGTVTGRIDNADGAFPGDRDWFALELEAGQFFELELDYTPEDLTGYGRIYSRVNDPRVFSLDPDTGAPEGYGNIVAERSGTYLVELSGYYGADYTLSAREPFAFSPERLAEYLETGFPQTRDVFDVVDFGNHLVFGGGNHVFRSFIGGEDDIIQASDRATLIGGGGRDLMLGGAWGDLLIGELGLSASQIQASFQVAMLYELLLGRAIGTIERARLDSDFAGMGHTFFVNDYVETWARDIILTGTEFAARYGPLDLSDRIDRDAREDFLISLFGEMRNAAPGRDELLNWVNFSAYAGGAPGIALRFAAAPETFDRFATDTIPDLLPPTADAGDLGFLFAAYDYLLDRVPDVTGLEGWGFSLARGAQQQEVLSNIMASREYRLKSDLPNFFAPTEEETETALRALGPGPDAATLAAWLRENAEDDTLVGRAGNDMLVGGALSDTFVFAPAEGFNRVLDFEAWDFLDLRAFDFTDADAALAAFDTEDGKAVFNEDGTAIVLYGFPADALSPEMLLV